MSVSVLACALESRMKFKGISVEALSRYLGYVHSPIVRMWLDGGAHPSVDQLPGIARQLDMDVVQLGLLYVMDCSELMDEAVRRCLRDRGAWLEIANAGVRTCISSSADMSIGDPHDAVDEVPF